ncbi:MAG TPA: Trk system potassium transporter TrkA [Spirochaetota bacterium]|nr:Trk system potassium transporter TrkA [Spirochaetota bacterium]HQO01384.1 Trk system potassium transporter TrkA [Spirochaetota bacterium]HQP48501.1 Trk system potassium transporter TrkA [Spirochaetota bacterium]
MHIVIVGAGSIGLHIASQLITENKDVVLIEKNPERAKYVSNHLDCMVINDDGTNLEILKQAGIEKADFFISVTDSDEVNMISCGLVSSEFDVSCKIARVRNLDYSNTKILDRSFLDIDFIVNPEVEAARVTGATVTSGATSDIMIFEKTDIQVRNFFVEANSLFMDKTLKDIRMELKEDFLISAIVRKSSVIIPSGITYVRENDTLYLVANQKNLERVFMKLGKPVIQIKSVVIVGGGTIGKLVARDILAAGYSVKIIEKDYELCKELSAQFEKSLVINADISDEGIFEEERLFENDLIIAATENQELNILSAIYAKSLGVKRAIAIVSKSSYLTIASELGIDSTISPKSSAADTILKYVRGSNIESIHSIFEGKAEVIEFTVGGDAPIINRPLKDIEMPDSSLIISVTRNHQSHIPGGDFVILSGDSVLIITKKKSIPKIEMMFTRTNELNPRY